jgi:predicted transcriptional regulator of viral defense system
MRNRPGYRQMLREVALDHYGYVTSSDARRLGVPATELPKLAARGGLQRLAWGLYRFDDIPTTQRDGYMEAVLLGGEGAVLSHDAALAVHGLAMVNPTTTRVTTPRRIRRRLPGHIVLIRGSLPDGDKTVYFGLPCATVARALVDCIPLVRPDRLAEAADQALAEGLLTRAEHRRVKEELHGGS